MREKHEDTQEHRIALSLLISQAIQKYAAAAVYKAGKKGDRGDYEPLRSLGLTVETYNGVVKIALAALDALTRKESSSVMRSNKIWAC